MSKESKPRSASKGAVRRRDLEELVKWPILNRIATSEELFIKTIRDLSDLIEILGRQKALELQQKQGAKSEEKCAVKPHTPQAEQ